MHKHAPFSPKEIEALKLYQTCGYFHPYTCRVCGSDVIPIVDGLWCTECHSTQTQVFNWTACLDSVRKCISNLSSSLVKNV